MPIWAEKAIIDFDSTKIKAAPLAPVKINHENNIPAKELTKQVHNEWVQQIFWNAKTTPWTSSKSIRW